MPKKPLQIIENKKLCTLCKETKPIESFWVSKKQATGLQARCKDCQRIGKREYNKNYYKKNIERAKDYRRKNKNHCAELHVINSMNYIYRSKSLILNAKKRASQSDRTFNVSVEDIILLMQNGYCSKTGLPFDMAVEGFRKPFSPSLDRIDNNTGYEVGNIQMVCTMFNIGKAHHREIDFIAMCCAVAERHRDDPDVIRRLSELRNAEF